MNPGPGLDTGPSAAGGRQRLGGGIRRALLVSAGTATLGACVMLLPSPAQARPFELGLTDPVFSSAAADERNAWLGRAAAVGARSIVAGVSWTGIAPGEPSAAFDPTDPGDPEYDFSAVDAMVRSATARGIDPVLLVTGAPSWAEGPNPPADRSEAPPGTWKPRPRALNEFAKAIAGRYSGTFDDPGDATGVLPRIRDYQLWAEPNLSTYLTPQFRAGRPVGGRHYRKMLRAFYPGIHSVSRHNRVVTGGTAPYGDLPGKRASRTQPALFWREVLCLKGAKLRKRRCRRPAKFDVLAHHPINVAEPQRRAFNRDDVSTPDIGKLRRILKKARRTGRALPRRAGKRIWASEIWWDSRPPDPDGVPARRHARWLAQSFHLLWKQRVERVVWFLIRDQPEGAGFGATAQSGLYTVDGRPKLAHRAYAFPFVAEPRRGRTSLWGVAPGRGKVKVQRRRGGSWKRVAGLRAKGRSRVFKGRARVRRGSVLRAVQGRDRSVPFTAR